ncbi:glycosyltransferase [Naumannella halotolerans]|uniref:glycosyltransferase n=1 Tax=Naumannella halotolerans TaxID=993414 RepID=UPI001414E1DF|nr:glycosyltransferase [Naumannella halotolerans]
MSTAPLRVQSVPSAHNYVRHLRPVPPEADLRWLADPPVPGAPSGQWWPSPVFDPGWAAQRTADLVHLHFGFDHLAPAAARDWLAELRRAGIALVLTVHDLTNPHLHDQSGYRQTLGVLVQGADAVITLTPGAATEIAEHWQREAVVLPHPHVVGLDRLCDPRPRMDGPLRVLLPLGALRANTDPELIPVIARQLPAGSELTVDLRPGLRARLAPELRGDGRQWQVVERAAGDEDEFFDHVAGFDVIVLPYRWGTHSGWVELGHDLGRPVVAPRIGWFHQQHAVHSWTDPGASLAAALADAIDAVPQPATADQRRTERAQLSRRHREIYDRVSGGGVG